MKENSANRRNLLTTTVRLLFFRSTREELLHLGGKHLALGIFCTWVVGMGRYWDNPRVSLLQHLGIGSVIYIFVLALLLWLIAWPLKPRAWSYFRVLTFVSLVSPPAILYAIPVERAFNLEVANSINAWFLAIVAAWRVALLIFFLRRLGKLEWPWVVTATLLPLTLIVVTLTILNLEKVVFDFMGGFRDRSPNDEAYGMLFAFSLLAYLLFIPLLLCYIYLVVKRKYSTEPENPVDPE
jgi:hypothetical protein